MFPKVSLGSTDRLNRCAGLTRYETIVPHPSLDVTGIDSAFQRGTLRRRPCSYYCSMRRSTDQRECDEEDEVDDNGDSSESDVE